ncbi:bifunctional phosphoribosyl-AMP cyclohydrolase/phosphoribosyl-ATP diphosphatase [Candidatus Uhrbacteria bacterium RIFOXYB12_FULL_58_10]|uniref:Histidine biosynthesis bifunctional protein HisIE n=1 Tax=Candidatus Uhrbacteria bacterium RIFOXYB2_FULL_57_15 TaxID=1802422 RepID=A0A1F7W7A2_9BACT|nr:MAG: bifunctional phosphoribosyl-AMP cyclohydrolase/phosphoribosyl-ATP diphosphatase [Candidatus Uhrbacteria bacterium RIFOXYB12_FULL_58_10]OGL98258.1 MAG: bifunctional phosphoribosyl-AMP cyclohydrolase/phosphoribosyl-ATP diphosphatase [Candidatus Uhrbacteria bacterium RIFOXYB2_FULL_57_15]OGL98947.1 MAG: bifunctional phosphoribosyl-AMP cyclohydrolase/phosphoribosyl-ATP diphosphatase [Candidatus Uhrbacteria bacterium RIFOXYC12_FULL_57_11]
MDAVTITIDWEKGKGLVPVIVQEANMGGVLMLGYMNQEAFETTVSTGEVVFFSRSKNCLWRKGETSGNTLTVVGISVDCDQDAILIQAVPAGPTCHTGLVSCFGDGENLPFLSRLERIIDERMSHGDETSYVRALKQKGTRRIAQKVGEEGVEVSLAAVGGRVEEITEESADLLFHLLVCLRDQSISLGDVIRVLRARHRA